MSTEWPANKYALGRPSLEWGAKELAYDGDESTIIHNDMSDKNPFWIGELGRVCNIKSIRIVNRPGIQWKGQMANYQVSILDKKSLFLKVFSVSNLEIFISFIFSRSYNFIS